MLKIMTMMKIMKLKMMNHPKISDTHSVYHGYISKKQQKQACRPLTRSVTHQGNSLLNATSSNTQTSPQSTQSKSVTKSRTSRKKAGKSKKTTTTTALTPSGRQLYTTTGQPIQHTRQFLSTMNADTFGCIVYSNSHDLYWVKVVFVNMQMMN